MATLIPSFGATNGVSGAPLYQPADPAVDTVFAVMYNYYDPTLISDNAGSIVTNSTNRIALNPYGVNPHDASNNTVLVPNTNPPVYAMQMHKFLNLFYATNAGYFNVNQTNSNNPAVIFSKQTYTSSNSNSDVFSLVQFLLRAYSTNKGISVNDIDSRIIILLQKECFVLQSLAGIKGTTISMSWDEVINSLVRSGVMDPSGNATLDASGNATNESVAVVPLVLVLNIHSFVLDIDLSIKFVYLVAIEGYGLPLLPPAQPTYNSSNQVIVPQIP